MSMARYEAERFRMGRDHVSVGSRDGSWKEVDSVRQVRWLYRSLTQCCV